MPVEGSRSQHPHVLCLFFCAHLPMKSASFPCLPQNFPSHSVFFGLETLFRLMRTSRTVTHPLYIGSNPFPLSPLFSVESPVSANMALAPADGAKTKKWTGKILLGKCFHELPLNSLGLDVVSNYLFLMKHFLGFLTDAPLSPSFCEDLTLTVSLWGRVPCSPLYSDRHHSVNGFFKGTLWSWYEDKRIPNFLSLGLGNSSANQLSKNPPLSFSSPFIHSVRVRNWRPLEPVPLSIFCKSHFEEVVLHLTWLGGFRASAKNRD